MALDFPNSPTNGQVYTDAATGEQWVYESATNSWTSKGLVNTSGGLVYKGSVDITAAPPAGVSSGWQYSVLADGTANAGYGPGITGTVTKGDIIMYTGTGWTDTSHNVPQATAAVAGIDKKLWKRSGSALSPETAGDAVQISPGTAAGPGLTPVGDLDTGVFSAGADQIGLATGGAGRLYVAANGNVGVNAASPNAPLCVNGLTPQKGTVSVVAATGGRSLALSDNINCSLYVSHLAGGALLGTDSGNAIRFATDGFGSSNEKARLDNSGRLLLGASSAFAAGGDAQYGKFQMVGNSSSATEQAILALGRGENATAITANKVLGNVTFSDSAGNTFASINSNADADAGAGSHPGRLVFSTCASGSINPTERVRITSSGFLKASDDGTYFGATTPSHEFRTSAPNVAGIISQSTSASYADGLHYWLCARPAASAYNYLVATSGYGGVADDVFKLTGDGNGRCDGAWTGGGADYAEYFEWSDDNIGAEDRRGISVVLDGEKIRPALAGEDPIGVISGNPSVVGDSAWNKWHGKYLRDEFGTCLLEDYKVDDQDGNTVIQQRRKLNPTYDPDVKYTSREERPEWDCVGLMGKLRIRKGQPTGSRWIKMRDISDSVEEWLVR
jgi:hypothetical protein